MKKYIYIAVASLFAFAACEKEAGVQEEVTPVEEPEVKELVTITASIPEEGLTKVALTPQDGATKTVKLEWEVGDVITINGKEFEIDKTTISDDKKSAAFKGDEPTPVDGKYTIVYTKAPRGSFANQQQSTDGAYDHLGYNVTLGDVTDYSNITFSSDWAVDNSATFSQASVLWLRALLPSTVAENVKKVIVKASQKVFNGTNTFTVSLDTPGVQSGDDKLDIYATIPEGAVTSGAMDLLVQFQVDADHEYDKYTAYRQIPGGTNFGESQYIGINCANIESYANKSNVDIGTSGNPYLIGDQHQMDAMHSEMKRGFTTYFKLVDDINMTGVVWFPLNNGYDSPGSSKLTGDVYNKFVNFDGNSKMISYLETKSGDVSTSEEYAALFGALVGEVHHLTIDHATIHPKSKSGVLAGWIGVNAAYAAASNVHHITISNSSATSGGSYLGVLAGQSGKKGNTISEITISDCTISTTGYAAGLVAAFTQTATVSDIIVQGTDVTSTGESTGDGYAGGIAASVTAAVDFDRCTYKKNTSTDKTATLTGPKCTKDNANSQTNRYIGGIAGYVSDVNATFDDCHVNTIVLNLNAAGGDNNYRYMGGAFGGIESAVVIGNTTGCSVTGLSTGSNIRNYVGGFVGINNGGTIKNSSAAGSITGNQGGRGGFVGFCHGGTFVDNSTTVTVSGQSNLGGFVGMQDIAASFTRCHSSGDVIGNGGYIGGFCGQIGNGSVDFKGSFSDCYVYNAEKAITISGKGNAIGGFVGWIGHNTYAGNTGTIEKCYVKNVNITSEGGAYVGGFAGVAKTDISSSWVDNINITSNKNSDGGFIGYLTNAKVSDCYAKGVTMNITNNKVGGFVGNMSNVSATIQRSYADVKSITCDYSYGGFVGAMTGIVDKCIAWYVHDFHDGTASPASDEDNYIKSDSETGTILSHAKESPRSWNFSTVWNEVDPPTLK